jgi:hypothetical protein
VFLEDLDVLHNAALVSKKFYSLASETPRWKEKHRMAPGTNFLSPLALQDRFVALLLSLELLHCRYGDFCEHWEEREFCWPVKITVSKSSSCACGLHASAILLTIYRA